MDRTNQIYKNFAGELKGFIKSRVNDKSITNDLLQEVFVKIHSAIDTLADETKLRSWIYQITRNTIIDHYRRVKPLTVEFQEFNFFEQVQEVTPREHLADSIRKMIDELPEKYSEPLCLNECYGLSQKEVAEKLDISYSGVKSRIQRARQMLKDELMKCCHYEFDKYGMLIDYHPITCCCCKRHPEK